MQFGAIIYFAVDFDATDAQITNNIIPYFKSLYSVFMNRGGGRFRVGVYGTRNLCTRICNAGYAYSSFVSDMSTGFSGNLGFTIPSNWAFDQFATTTISSNGKSIEIDKDGFSGRYKGISQEYSVAENEDIRNTNTNEHSFVLANCGGTSIPVYEKKEHIDWPLPQSGTQYGVAGKKIGEIKVNDFYVFFGVASINGDNIHKVLFNDGIDVKEGYIEGQAIYPGTGPGWDSYSKLNEANSNQAPKYQEPYACWSYDPNTNSYTLLNTGANMKITINKPVPYFKTDGTYEGMLNNGDEITISYGNKLNVGSTRPWCYRVNEIRFKDGKTSSAKYVSVGLEYGSSGIERAWY